MLACDAHAYIGCITYIAYIYIYTQRANITGKFGRWKSGSVHFLMVLMNILS